MQDAAVDAPAPSPPPAAAEVVEAVPLGWLALVGVVAFALWPPEWEAVVVCEVVLAGLPPEAHPDNAKASTPTRTLFLLTTI